MSSDLPIVVEIVDKPEKIEGFLDTVAEMVSDGMATLEKVQVLFYRAGKAHKG
jgi:PII-like signaling protein